MKPYVLTPLAIGDIFEIWRYIAEDDDEAADRVEQAIYEACTFLGQGPKPHTLPIEIVAVIHGKRNIPRALRQRS